MKKVLVIGSGGISHSHGAALKTTGKAEVVGLVDLDKQRAEAFAAKWAPKAPIFVDAAEAVSKVKPDCIALFTPAHARLEYIELAVKEGLPVMMEKPPCHTVEAGEAILKLLDESGLIHSVGFMSRYNQALNAAMQAVQGDKLTIVQILYESPMADVQMAAGYPNPYSLAKSGGLVGDQGVHYLDAARYITGSEAVQIAALGLRQRLPLTDAIDTVDKVGWTLAMENGALVSHGHTWCASQWKCRISIITDHSSVDVDMFANLAQGLVAGQPWSYQGTPNSQCFEVEWLAFFEAMETGSMAPIRSPYADALASYRLAMAVNEKVYG